MRRPSELTPVLQAAWAVTVLLAACVVAYGGLWMLDFGSTTTPLALLANPEVASLIGGVGEVTVAVLGIAVTVVAIIVELAANRYTPRISELFLRDPVNAVVMGFFVVTSVLVLWVGASLSGPAHPVYMVGVTLAAMSLSLLLLLPYFAYVFDFLTPTQVILRFQRRTQASLRSAERGAGRALDPVQAAVLGGIEQLGELALNSVDKNDKAIALSSVAALAAVAQTSIERKSALPVAWFRTSGPVAEDQDFVSLHVDMVRAIEERRSWVEMKVLRQYQAVFGAALNRVRDVNHLVAMHTRQIGVIAHERGDDHALRLAVRFMNTYLRATINGRDVRTAYNLFNEYRGLAEALLDEHRAPIVIEMAERFKYYGQVSFHANLGFILETAAYDLCALIERASERGVSYHDELLDILLELDHEPEEDGRIQEASLRGVRKAQVKLATWYLANGDEDRARRIYHDMRAEKGGRMASIREELDALTEPEFWEVSDRGINFDWLPPAQRAQLPVFFGWFEGETVVAAG